MYETAEYTRLRKYMDKTMSRKLRARKTEEGCIGKVFEKVVEGMRNEMSTVLWRI